MSHPHFDHFGGARAIAEASGAEVWVSENASHRVENYEEEFKGRKKFAARCFKVRVQQRLK